MSREYALGFRSVDREYAAESLPVRGTLPSWLSGVLLRNGPAKFEVGDERVAHWFDGLAMLTRFAVEDGDVTYTNRFLRSDEYREVTERDRLAGGQFGSSNGGLFGSLRERILPSVTDNANVNVLRVGDRFVAITETQLGVEFDPATLETVGQYTFDGLDGQTMTAHPHVDPRTGETVTFTTEFGATSHYRFYRLPAGGERFEAFGSVAVQRPAYVHSFALTADHVVLVEFPLDVHPLELLWPGSDAFIERYTWRPSRGTRFRVLSRQTGEVVTEATTEAFFAFHHVNAFADDGALVVDVAAFEDASVVDSLYLETLQDGPVPALDGQLRRYRVPLSGGNIERETLYADGVTLPRIHPRRDTRPYRYVYGQGPPRPSAGVDQHLLKVDTRTGDARTWVESGTYCGEPVFVPRPGADGEDAGVVLSVLLETDAERSSLLVLDGETFEEVARAPLPHVVPFDFHGQFFADRSGRDAR